MKNFIKTLKGKIVLGSASAVIVTAVVVTAVLMGQKQESYRTIVVEEVNGIVQLSNDKKDKEDVYEGAHLYNGDSVEVNKDSYLVMQLDMDKYVLAEENTKFKLEAAGKEGSTKTSIILEEGAALNRLKNSLEENESYEVSTPNATMSVRGTVFRIMVYVGEDGLKYSQLEVLDGKVEVELMTEDGKTTGTVEVIEAGQAVLMRGDMTFSEFVPGEDGEIIREIEYSKLPKVTAEKLVEYIDDGEEFKITKELLMDYTSLAEHKMKETILEEATCEKTGKMERVCEVCGQEKEIVEIPVSEHKGEKWITIKEAVCTEVGSEEQHCKYCDKLIATRAVNALGHEAGEWETTVTATCTAVGSERQSCARCDEVLATREVPMSAHVEGRHETVEGKEATCTKDGSERIYCAVCEQVIEVRALSAEGHKLGKWTTVKSSTCTEKGKKEQLCTVCGTVVKTEEIAASGHELGAWKVTKEATCMSDGKRIKACKVCKKTVQEETISATGHTPLNQCEWVVTKEATCTTDGNRIKKCKVCSETLSEEVIQATGHGSWVHGTITPIREAGEDFPTSWTVLAACGNPNCTVTENHTLKEDSDQSGLICEECNKMAHTHTVEAWEIIDATCEEDGYKEGYCDVCEKQLIDISLNSKLGHDWTHQEKINIESTTDSEGNIITTAKVEAKCSRESCIYNTELQTHILKNSADGLGYDCDTCNQVPPLSVHTHTMRAYYHYYDDSGKYYSSRRCAHEDDTDNCGLTDVIEVPFLKHVVAELPAPGADGIELSEIQCGLCQGSFTEFSELLTTHTITAEETQNGIIYKCPICGDVEVGDTLIIGNS